MDDFRNMQPHRDRLLIGLIIFMFAVTIQMATGCGVRPGITASGTTTRNMTSSVTTKKTDPKATSSATTTQTAITTLATTSSQEIAEDEVFLLLERALDTQDVYFEKNWMYAEAVGALEGYKYATRSGTFELYLYDTSSDAYKTALKNQAMLLSGTSFPAIVKDGVALYFYPNAKESLQTTVKAILFDAP